jgi:hypothetical protein
MFAFAERPRHFEFPLTVKGVLPVLSELFFFVLTLRFAGCSVDSRRHSDSTDAHVCLLY